MAIMPFKDIQGHMESS